MRTPRSASQSRFCAGDAVVLGEHLLLQLHGPCVAWRDHVRMGVTAVVPEVMIVCRAVLDVHHGT